MRREVFFTPPLRRPLVHSFSRELNELLELQRGSALSPGRPHEEKITRLGRKNARHEG